MVMMTLKQLRELFLEMVDPYGAIPTAEDPTGAVRLAGQLYDIVSAQVLRKIDDLYDEGYEEEAERIDEHFDDEVLDTITRLVKQAMPQQVDVDRLAGVGSTRDA